MEERSAQSDIIKTIEQEMDSDVHPLLKKILDNIRPIGIAVGGIVAAVAVYSGFNAYQSSQRDKAVSELGAIIILDDQAARTSKLEAFVSSGPADLRPAPSSNWPASSWRPASTTRPPRPGRAWPAART
jgi:type II secretory pathway pseudopilin PulG